MYYVCWESRVRCARLRQAPPDIHHAVRATTQERQRDLLSPQFYQFLALTLLGSFSSLPRVRRLVVVWSIVVVI